MRDKPVYMLVVSAHPTDPEMSMGGTMARWTQEGKEIVYVICTNGDAGSSDPDMMPEELARIREQEQLASAEYLGVKEVIFLRHPNLGLEDTPEFRKEILRLILEYRPEIVATVDPYTRYITNRDHRITGQVTLDAVWPYALSPNTYRDLLEQGLKLHKVKEVLLWGAGEPNYRLDITGMFDRKMESCRYHKSQIGDPMEQGFIDLMMSWVTTAAEGQNFKYGEAFHRIEVPQRL